MDVGHHLRDARHDLFGGELYLSKESAGHREKGLFWPLMEPVDASLVDKSRESSGSDTELLTYWREAEVNMEVAFNLLKEEFPELIGCIQISKLLSFIANLAHDFIKFLLCKQVWDVACSENIIDVDQEVF